ncbi:hypothetical protein [Fimbriiglobus ruber]|uniref:Uncharacterized protein n=1 Tax=Fimbriiglobus ruber TaxID=1908690 RepID=A0A225D4D6_9BACT|nr:hypothetical protein [Fimbriiglobus ruber]OWK34504.1 hypothetical protein FRUB_10475 [Fimbriiglobus ruber]
MATRFLDLVRRAAESWARRAILSAILLSFLAHGFARAEDSGADDKLVAKRLEWHVLSAKKELAEWEMTVISPPSLKEDIQSLDDFEKPDVILTRFRVALEKTSGDLRQRTDVFAAKVRDRRAVVEADWRGIYHSRIEFQRAVDARQADYGFDFEANRAAPFRGSLVDAGIVLWGAGAWFVCWRLAARETRVARRRAAYSRRAAAIGSVAAIGLLGLSGCGALLEKASWAEREDARLTTDTAAAETAATTAQRAADLKWAQAVNAWARLLAAREDSSQTADGFRQKEDDLRGQLEKLRLDAMVAERLADEAEADRAKMTSDRKRLEELQSESQLREFAINVGRAVFAAGLAAGSAAPLLLAVRRNRRRLAEQVNECPRCRAAGQLAVRDAAVPDKRYPEPEYVECQVCTFRFRKSDSRFARLCFPVVGVRSSGKTHMLVTAYDRVRSGSVPTSALIQPTPSLGDDLFERYIDLVLRKQGQAGATVHTLPEPVVLRVRDADRAGANTVLVNVFDFSGEMMDARLETDLLRRRAVMNDGFMMLLDPTQLYGRNGHLRLEDQIRAMQAYYDDLRELHRVPAGEVIPIPVAVCISKFDLLVSDNPIRGQAVPFIQKILKAGDGRPTITTGVVAARSAVVEQMLPLLFPGIDLLGILRGYFGGQVLFFPMSSVSLFEGELGVKDVKRRTMAPFGVIEPLLWLTHMQGYKVLS